MKNLLLNDFANTVLNNKKQNEIRAYFRDGKEVIYTYNIIDLLKTENDVVCITDNQTGEILWERKV